MFNQVIAIVFMFLLKLTGNKSIPDGNWMLTRTYDENLIPLFQASHKVEMGNYPRVGYFSCFEYYKYVGER